MRVVAQARAVAGVLMARGTIDGGQLEALLFRMRRVQQDEANQQGDWMDRLARWPLVWGVVWGLVECPKRSNERRAIE